MPLWRYSAGICLVNSAVRAALIRQGLSRTGKSSLPNPPRPPNSRMQAKRCVGATRLNFLILFLHPRTLSPHRHPHYTPSSQRRRHPQRIRKRKWDADGHRQLETLRRVHYFIRRASPSRGPTRTRKYTCQRLLGPSQVEEHYKYNRDAPQFAHRSIPSLIHQKQH